MKERYRISAAKENQSTIFLASSMLEVLTVKLLLAESNRCSALVGWRAKPEMSGKLVRTGLLANTQEAFNIYRIEHHQTKTWRQPLIIAQFLQQKKKGRKISVACCRAINGIIEKPDAVKLITLKNNDIADDKAAGMCMFHYSECKRSTMLTLFDRDANQMDRKHYKKYCLQSF